MQRTDIKVYYLSASPPSTLTAILTNFIFVFVVDHNGLLYDLQEIQRAQKEGMHKHMLGFVAGSTDRAMHLQVTAPLLAIFMNLTLKIGVTKVVWQRGRGEKADKKLRASVQ